MKIDLRDWAGDAWAELDATKQARLVRAAESIDERYPDPDDQPEREAALSTAVQYMLGETTAAEVRERLNRARVEAMEALAAAQQFAVMAIEDGGAEATTAREVGVDRMTVRSWLGKTR